MGDQERLRSCVYVQLPEHAPPTGPEVRNVRADGTQRAAVEFRPVKRLRSHFGATARSVQLGIRATEGHVRR